MTSISNTQSFQEADNIQTGVYMKNVLAFIALAATLIAPSHADVIYTAPATFAPQVAAGAYTETFNTSTANAATKSFTNGVYSYTISAGSGAIYSSGAFLGTASVNTSLRISFTGAAVTALGGNFYATDFSDVFQATSILLTLSDGTVQSFLPNSVSDSFRGFTTGVGITSLTLGAPGASRYVGLDNFTVGAVAPAVVPEPASLAIMGAGLAGLVAMRRRRAA